MRKPRSFLAISIFLAGALTGLSTHAQMTRAPMPAAETVLTRLAFGSCADEELPQPIWRAIAADSPELFLFMGDNVYVDIEDGEWVESPDATTFEAAYDKLSRVAPFADFYADTPVLATWDDHDYGVNDAGVEFPLKHEAKRFMLDFFGVADTAPVRERPGVYRSRIFGPPGRRMQIILLDTRWFRSPLVPTDERGAPGKERYLPDADPSKTMLGDAQWDWLEHELAKPAELRLIVSSVQVLADGHGWERWGNLPAERARLYRLVEESEAKGVVILSGDRHRGALYRRHGVAGYPVYEITASSLNRPSHADQAMDEYGPHQLTAMYAPENFGLLTVDWETGTLDLALKGIDGARVRGITLALADIGIGQLARQGTTR